jgi:uncharacterized protein
MSTKSIAKHFVLSKTGGKQQSVITMILLHLLPGGLTMLLMLLVSPLLQRLGIYPGVPVFFVFVAPALILMQLGYLYYQGKRLNGKYSLQGIVLYRDHPMPWWKTAVLALPILAWIAFVFFVAKPPLNGFFLQHFFAWMPANFLDEAFLTHLDQYSPSFLRVIGVLFTLSITLGGVVEELYLRGYLLPRMESLGGWAPFVNVLLFSLYHFWSPWENVVRLLALTPWVYATWRTRNLYLPLLIHSIINAFSGISLMILVLGLIEG